MSTTFEVPILPAWQGELWETALDLGALLSTTRWALSGAQAVAAHGFIHDPDAATTGRDLDRVGRIITDADSFDAVRQSLRYLGFDDDVIQPPHAVNYCFRRPAESGSFHEEAQVWTVSVLGTTTLVGGDQAFARTTHNTVATRARAAVVPMPDLLSTMILEAAQFGSDTANPFCHARNAAYLMSLLPDPVHERQRLTEPDERLLRALDAAVGRHDHHVWTELDDDHDTFARWRALLSV